MSESIEKRPPSDGKAAYTELFQRNVTRLTIRAAEKNGNDWHAAEDLAQEVFLRAWKGTIRDATVKPTYLHMAARSIEVDAHRYQALRPTEVVFDPTVAERQLRHDPIETTITQHALLEAIATLPVDLREIIVSHHMFGESQAEIASRLGISTDAVKKKASRGRALLRGALAEHGITGINS